jgi:hypothetical protein
MLENRELSCIPTGASGRELANRAQAQAQKFGGPGPSSSLSQLPFPIDWSILLSSLLHGAYPLFSLLLSENPCDLDRFGGLMLRPALLLSCSDLLPCLR